MGVEWLSEEAIQTSLHCGQQQSDLLLGMHGKARVAFKGAGSPQGCQPGLSP